MLVTQTFMLPGSGQQVCGEWVFSFDFDQAGQKSYINFGTPVDIHFARMVCHSVKANVIYFKYSTLQLLLTFIGKWSFQNEIHFTNKHH